MRRNEGWDFRLRGCDPQSPTARLPGICRRLRTRRHQGVSPHRGRRVCESKRAKGEKLMGEIGCEMRGGSVCVNDKERAEGVRVCVEMSKCVCEGRLVLQAHLGPPGSFFSPFYWPRLTAMKWQQIYCSAASGCDGGVRTRLSSHPSSLPLPLFLASSFYFHQILPETSSPSFIPITRF